MTTATTTPDATRHRLLEGVLLRLARRPDVGDFVVRGGVLMRHWFRPVPRPADDLDLVATRPLSADEAARRVTAALGDDGPDGVAFDPGARAETIPLDTGPALRLFASGSADGEEAEFHIDITFGPFPRPAPVFGTLPTACGVPIRAWMCRPESVFGHKMQAMLFRGALGWRPKDLEDLRLLLGRVPMDAADLRGAVAAYVADAGGTGADARAIFGPSSWWGMKMASARWGDFVSSSRGRHAPRDLAAAVAEVAGRLAPVLEGVP